MKIGGLRKLYSPPFGYIKQPLRHLGQAPAAPFGYSRAKSSAKAKLGTTSRYGCEFTLFYCMPFSVFRDMGSGCQRKKGASACIKTSRWSVFIQAEYIANGGKPNGFPPYPFSLSLSKTSRGSVLILICGNLNTVYCLLSTVH